MPTMTSPNGRDTLEIPDQGVAAMRALGWSTSGGRKASNPEPAPEPEPEAPRRGPGRPRKRPEGE